MFSPFKNSSLKKSRPQKGFSVICVYNNREKLEKYLEQSLKKQTVPYELITIDNTTGKFHNAAPILNEAAKKARYEYLMFVHQDISLHSVEWLAKAVKDLEKIHQLGAAGVAGKRDEKILASVSHGNPPRFAGKKRLKKPVPVQTLDGCLMIVPKENFLKMPFDEAAVDGWMLYVTNYCLDLIRQGYRSYVLPHEVYHESTGCEDRAAIQNVMSKIIVRHKDHIKTIYTTVGTWKTNPRPKTSAKAALPWPASLSWFMIQRKFLGRKLPLLASFKVTYRCNLTCRACPFHLRTAEDNMQMSWCTAIETLESLYKLGTRIIIFEGGEPLLWRDGSHSFHDLVLYAQNLFLRVAVTTKGTLPLDVPSDILWVSLDGLKETHDELRSDSYDRVWSNIMNTRHPRVYIHCTLNRRNRQVIEPLAKLVKATPTLKGMTVQFFYPYNQGEEDLALEPLERREVIEKLLKLKKAGYPILNSAGRLKAMMDNNWTCHDDILINVDPDGTITKGCYVKSRGKINCEACGFTPVAEASGALDLIPGSLYAGWSLFLKT